MGRRRRGETECIVIMLKNVVALADGIRGIFQNRRMRDMLSSAAVTKKAMNMERLHFLMIHATHGKRNESIPKIKMDKRTGIAQFFFVSDSSQKLQKSKM